ncbi:Protein XRP2 [Trichuris trichiura]|uniref:Protein XRP2 n=1 Tax=Trichuris trichiura TaxID=36087 RepID=A0A077YZ80_TRITR|nr:Protein XRP2 [Trichuris trichiura]
MAGQQFTIENCQSCKIFVLDRTASIIIDDCQDCQIVLGPCSGSVFIRNSLDCRLWVLCQQFRIRDCRKLQVSLYCQSSPSLESSRSIEFTCLQISYYQLDGEWLSCNQLPFSSTVSSCCSLSFPHWPLCAAGLKTLNNYWAHAHDFSADESLTANFLCSCEVRLA